MKETYVTHDGSPHLDDVLAFATLKLCRSLVGDELELIRSRNPKCFQEADWVVDVGGLFSEESGRLDHHQYSASDPMRPKRENSVGYAAAGMMWKAQGALCIDRVCARAGLNLSEEEKRKLFIQIDHDLYQPIDSHDNGELEATAFHHEQGSGVRIPLANVYLHDLVLDYSYGLGGKQDTDSAFTELATALERMVHARILRYAEEFFSRSLLHSAERLHQGAVLFFPVQVPSALTAVLHEAEPEVMFAVYPSGDSSDWTIRAIPESKGSFSFRRGFPADWRGLMATTAEGKLTLRERIHLPGAVFCHAGGFIAKAKDSESAKIMAVRACAENPAVLH